MSVSVIPQVKYITDASGSCHEVIIPIQSWKNIVEELENNQEKKQILSGLKQACIEAKKQENGEMPEQSFDEFLNEL